MAVTKEWRCFAHGPFEGTEAVCPHGCSTVIREFRTAPAGRSDKTKASDKALERMAKRYGLADISASKTGSVAGDRMAKQRGFGKIGDVDFSPRWGEIPKGGTYHAGDKAVIAREGSEGGADALVKNLSQGRAEPIPDNASALPTGPIPKRPRPVVVGRDSITNAQFSDALAKAS
jgi:hypothetical protein